MKLKNYLLAMVAVSMLFACSTDEPIDPAKPNATLSILTDAGILKTKAGSTPEDDIIKSLGVAVVFADGQVMTGWGTPTQGTQLLQTPVKGGVGAKVIVFANLKESTVRGFETGIGGGGSVATIMNTLQTLDKDTIGDLSMSSKVYTVDIMLGEDNAMGFGENPGGGRVNIFKDVINLYRNVARVQLGGLKLLKHTNYGTATGFKLKYVFMANVKNQTRLGSVDWSAADWGKVEVTPPSAWWYGAHPMTTDPEVAEIYNSILSGVEQPKWLSTYFSEENAETHTPVNLEIPEAQEGDVSWIPSSANLPWSNIIGDFYYVYENTSGDKGKQTHLIICGDYTHIPKGKTEAVTETNRFWTIPVNNMGNSTISSNGIAGHKGIRRNHIYEITLTISGSGSTNPYTPDTNVNLNAEVEVVNWSKFVEINDDVE